MLNWIKDTRLFAFWQGFCEHLRYDPDGRTHATDGDWNEAYDRGWNLADKLTGRTQADY